MVCTNARSVHTYGVEVRRQLARAPVVRHVELAAVARPLALELVLQHLGAALARQPRLVQAELAHLHVVQPRLQQHGRLVGVQLHLARHVLAVEVRVPPAAPLGLGRAGPVPRARAHERDAEVAVARAEHVACRRSRRHPRRLG